MYMDEPQLGDWKSTLKKVRDTVHKIFPRELSPTRMIEKYGSDAKKKADKKSVEISHMTDASSAALDAAQVSLAQVQAAGAAPGAIGTPNVNFQNPVAPVPSSVAPVVNDPPYLLYSAAGIAALALILLVTRK